MRRWDGVREGGRPGQRGRKGRGSSLHGGVCRLHAAGGRFSPCPLSQGAIEYRAGGANPEWPVGLPPELFHVTDE